MALPPSDESMSLGGSSEVEEELAAARDALLLFADAERVLDSLVCDPADPDCRYPDLRAVRQHATVDELLHVVVRIPEAEEDERGDEAASLYPTLLELAEVFDILIDQHSLVYGDAVALAESIEAGWHAMAGCYNHDATPEQASEALKQAAANLAGLPSLLETVGRLSAEARREAASRFERAASSAWRAEARYLASHGVDTWLPQGIPDARMQRALQPARDRPRRGASAADPAALFARATADLLLARLVRGIASDVVIETLEAPFAGLLRG